MNASLKLIGLCLLSAIAAPAQENSYIDSTRPTISSDAAIQQRGVLQIESGYDAYFLPYDQTGAVSLYYALTNWLRLDASVSAWRATDVGVDHRTEGVGNAEFGAKVVLFHQGRSKTIPGVAVEYEDNAASATRPNLRSRYHQGTLIFSNTAGAWEWKLNGSPIASSCRDTNGCVLRGQGALGVSYKLSHARSLDAEVFGQSVSVSAPPGAYAFVGLAQKLNEHVAVNGGLRFGLSAPAPAVGATFGVTVAMGGQPHQH